ncbi:hypothetical protein V5799_018484 [Amblyomma americanum]|uniref:Roadblock/LAMTOR2 domain-containing protein n=1 Tax=Amblyomma americanum TaxID=6943 RepID=A0AAQ4EZY5_AMBAM
MASPASNTRSSGDGSGSGGVASEEVEQVFRSLRGHGRVLGVVATTADGALIKSTLEDDKMTEHYAQLAAGICEQARSATADGGPADEPTFFKMKTRRHEIVISPSKKYTLMVLTEVPPPPVEQ